MKIDKHTVALVLTVGLSLWLVLMGVRIITQDFPVSDQLSTLLSTTLGALVGAIAVYLGQKDKTEEEIDLAREKNRQEDHDGQSSSRKGSDDSVS
jgi:uncharacterized membrane protein YqgA involved in biofilm formation